MEITVALEQLSGRLSSREPFLLGENDEVLMKLDTDYLLNDALVNFENGGETAKVRITKNPFVIPKKVVRAGVLNAEVCLCAHGRIVKTYRVEPIVFYSEPPTLVGHPEFDELKAENAKMKEEIIDLKKTLEAQANKLQDLKDAVFAIQVALEQ